MELQQIAINVAKHQGLTLTREVADLVAANCSGVPSRIDVLVKQLITVGSDGHVKDDDAAQVLSIFGTSPTMFRTDPNSMMVSVQDLSGVDFEKLITGLLERMGFCARMTAATTDGGIDVVADFDKPILKGRYLFQCKCYALDNVVGVPMLRDFFGAVTAERATKGVFITTSDFTAQARDFANKVGLELINRQDLCALLEHYGFGAAKMPTAAE